MQVTVSDGGLLCFFHNAFLKLSWPVVELLELESQFTGSFLRDQDEMGRGRTTGHKGKTWYQLASEQDRDIYICTDGNSNSQSQSKKNSRFSLSTNFPLYKRHVHFWLGDPGHSGVVCSSSAGMALSGSAPSL